jgi:hypothetical protein
MTAMNSRKHVAYILLDQDRYLVKVDRRRSLKKGLTKFIFIFLENPEIPIERVVG